MGGGASVHRGDGGRDDREASNQACCISSLEHIYAADLADRYQIAFKRHEEFLKREQKICDIHGFESHAPYQKPLMMEKLSRTLGCLDDLGASYSEDQRRCHGHAEVVLPELAAGGPITDICVLQDTATVACASSSGPMWVYNWREGMVVSSMRDGETGGHEKGFVRRICPASDSCALLGSGDDQGFVSVWGLTTASLVSEMRLHEGGVTGLRLDATRGTLVSTSTDTYIMVYDLNEMQVVERGVPLPCTCGSGVPNSSLEVVGGNGGKTLLVGGGDGKLRVWSRDDTGINRQCTLMCEGARPTEVLMASDGWTAVVATAPGDVSLLGDVTRGRGGLLLYDVRKLGGDGQAARVASHTCRGVSNAAAAGCIDLTLVEHDGQSLVLGLMDGKVQAFDLKGTSELVHKFDNDIVTRYESGANPCAMAATGGFVFVATTAPSLGVWERKHLDAPYGHKDYQILEPVPMVLKSTCFARSMITPDMGGVGAPALSRVQEALARDQERAARLTGAGPTAMT